MGPSRHLSLIGKTDADVIEWPVPFADGLPILEGLRGRNIVVLASGDPFWFGAASVITAAFDPSEWVVLPGLSTFSLAAARLGWALEGTLCLGLHAAPVTRLRPHLTPGQRAIVLLRDGAAVRGLADYLKDTGFGESEMTVLEALGGPRERVTTATAQTLPGTEFNHPVAVALNVAGQGDVLPKASGLSDGFFASDGQMTKRPMRALALSALQPKPYETLWDIGGGSGSIAIEWLLSHPTTEAVSVEPRADRALNIRANAMQLGVDRLRLVEGTAPDALDDLPSPNAVFIGGGLSDDLLTALTKMVPSGTRLVAHAVTLESEALLTELSERLGGTLLRFHMSEATPLGPKRGWSASYPVIQWQAAL